MTRPELLQRISLDPEVCFGKACIKGTRIWVALVIENLSAGISETALLEMYPQITHDDISACLAYAAELTRERVIPVPVPKAA